MSSPSASSTRTTWTVAAIVAYLAMVTMNALANLLPLFGRATGDVSDSYPSLFTPAPFTFGVWGVIYLALAAFVIYQATPAGQAEPRLRAVRPLFVLSCLLNVGWLLAWHGLQIPVSEVVMVALLLTLIAIYRAVGVRPEQGRDAGAQAGEDNAAFAWLVRLPFSLYLGWISVATIANTSIFLLDLGFDGGSAEIALTVLVIVVAAALGLVGVARRRDAFYALVIAWGLTGVAAARAGDNTLLLAVAAAGAVVLLAAAVWALVDRSRGRSTVKRATA